MAAISETVGRTDTAAGHPRRREAEGYVLLLLGVCLLLSLVSYDPSDPSWNVISGRASAANYIGRVGSHFADASLQALGLMAFAIPPLLFVWGWFRVRARRVRGLSLRSAGWLALILAVAGLLALFSPASTFIRQSIRPGGFLGLVLVNQLELRLNVVGTGLVLITWAGLSLMLAANISYMETAGRIHRVFGSLWPGLPWKKGIESLRITPEDPKRPSVKKTSIARTGMGARDPDPDEAPLLDDDEEFEQLPLIRTGKEVEDGLAVAGPKSTAGKLAGRSAGSESRGRPGAVGDGYAGRTEGMAQKEDPASDRAVVALLDGLVEDDAIAEMLSTAAVRRVKPSAGSERSPVTARRPPRQPGEFILPSPQMLNEVTPLRGSTEDGQEMLLQVAHLLAAKCKEFAVSGHVQQISPGPVVTTFEFKPDPGIKYSRITGLVDDLCLALEAESIRIDRIPGKSTVGIEVPNRNREIIYLREIIESRKFQDSKSKLTIALGKTIDGSIYVADLAKMPHLLIAGSTGAGKSVTVNSIIVSILMKASPDDVRFILIDPKRLELGLYQEIPHLLVPIVTDAKRASYALKWAVAEMEKRYRQLAGFGVRNIEQFNREIRDRGDRELIGEDGQPVRPLPYLVIMIDELADLMMVASNDVETSITRLAQMARAVGIHLVLTTQRPSVDVITGLIKANFPCRIAFRVSSKVDSRTIIDGNGAEQLLGKGDMLFLPPGTARLIRVHGAFVDEKEIKRIVEFIKDQGEPTYDETVLLSEKEVEATEAGLGRRDELYEEALKIVIHLGRASTSVLQRRLRIGYGRAAAIIDLMEREGFVETADGTRPRAITPKAAEFRERIQQMREE